MKCFFKKIWRDKWSYVLAAAFGILSIIQGCISLSRGPYSLQVNGPIMCTCLMLLSWQMILTQGRWFWVCIVGSLGQIFQVGIDVFVLGNKSSILGFTVICFVLAYQIIIYRYLKIQLRDKNTLKKIAITDKLTGLNNRFGFEQDIDALLEKGSPFYLMFLDLDNFKYVNDTLGHEAGDEVLQKVAQDERL